MYAIVNNQGKIEVHTDNYDLCYSCKNILKCPLIQAISKEYVFMHYSDVKIRECGLYKINWSYMSKIEINKLTNANVYMNGVNLLGRAEEVQLPQIKHKMAEHKALGMVGSAEFFAGIDKLECKIKWNALYPAVMAVCSNPFLATMIQVRANLETYNGTGRIKEVPATAFLIGTFKEFPLGNIKPQENAEYETTMSVTYAKLVVDGVEIFEIDVLENIYKVGMVDMLSTFKKNTGA